MLTSTDTIMGPTPPASAYLESYRTLRSSIMTMCEREPFRTALLTSTRDREGKTTVAINLATVISLVGKTTILVDADFYGAGLTRELQIPEGTPGLTDLCQGSVSVDDVLTPLEIDTMKVVPIGSDPNTGPELVASPVMRQTLDTLAKQADFVFIDCTPMTGFGTAISLAPIVDAVLFVTVARSDAQDVRRCIDDLADSGARLAGVVVNDILPEDSAVYRAFYRYYQHQHA